MTPAYRARLGRAARFAAAACGLVLLALLAHGAAAATQPDSDSVAISLVQSATAVPLGGTMGFSGLIRFPSAASSVQARLQVHRLGGRLVYQKTQYLDSAKKGTQTFAFARPLEGLGIDAGSYPVTFSVQAIVNGSSVSTDVTQPMIVYDASKPHVPVVLLVKVHSRPTVDPGGTFSVDPSSTAGTLVRDEVDKVASLVSSDPLARVTLAIPPVTIEEWKRVATGGYTDASGAVVPTSDPTPVAYAATLTQLQQALGTGRLELVTMGYSDPNLADLSANKLSGDCATQYDAGISAIFASLETTPSTGTAPAGGCIPSTMQRVMGSRRVTYTFAETDSTRIGKRAGVPTGAYPTTDTSLTALVIDARASRGLESGDASATLARTFERSGSSARGQPVVVRIDLDDSITDATSTVGFALATLEGTPWVRLELGSEAQVGKGARTVTFAPATTKGAPRDFWSTVRSARAHAAGMLALFSSSDAQATSAQTDSLLAEASEWSEPSAKWRLADVGLVYANAAIKTATSAFGAIKVSAPAVTLAGATGEIPVTIQNTSKKTMIVVVLTKTSGGIQVVGKNAVSTKLPPSDTYVQIPIDMQSALYGRLTVQVMAGSVVIAKAVIPVRRSYLDRLALIGGIVLVLGGMLLWIVLRVRRSPDVRDDEADDDAFDGDEPAAGNEESAHEPATSADDAAPTARYTGAHPSAEIRGDS